MSDTIFAVGEATLLVMFLGVPAAFVCGSVLLAACSGPPGRSTRGYRHHLVRGAVPAAIGGVALAFGAWSTHEDASYDGFGFFAITLAALLGGHLVLLGLGPLTSWILEVLGRRTGRLPLPMRLAVRDLADDRARTAPALATTTNATALAIAVMICAVALTAQHRAEYHPRARSGALVVNTFTAEDAAAVWAAVRRGLSGAPVAQSFRQREYGIFRPDVENVDLPDLEQVHPAEIIGDRALLRYLTGDPSTPYDEGTAVVVTSDHVAVDKVTIEYDLSEHGGPSATKTIPAIAAAPAAPHTQGIFLPAKVVRDLGYHLEPEELIIDPSLHRTSESERERLEDDLDDVADVYLEQGFQPPTGWRVFVGAALAVALAGAVAATGGTAAGGRAGRVLLRVRGGSTASLRWFAASRAGLGAACGTVLGAVAGCAVGLSLAWPLTAATGDWEVVPRAGFDTPWTTIAALACGLPVLVAIFAGLSVRRR
ncbi:hypothetical protein FHU36_002754 [Nonomuraea muscovyensis]|uniref:FtsX-like permease family protein n=1 Tax=Nonomuraea muscovyensis TaxID=1124761 RepID=A0A7X0C2E7_9ACTN|nr:hypothetical protein [Nonomuraea muscovyensis]MBB6346245.1 hypothetical protein [Nonomuraea muscovyensis]